MSQVNLHKEVQRLKEFIEVSITKNKPGGSGTKGSERYISVYWKDYREKLAVCANEIQEKANDMLNNFDEEEEGESKILKGRFKEVTAKLPLQFKRTHLI